MHRFRALVPVALVAVSFFTYVPAAHAANATFFGPLVPDASTLDPSCTAGAPLSMGAALQVAQNFLNLAITLACIIFVLILAYAGLLFLTSATNPENRSRARGMLTNAVIGFVIVLAGWLVVDFVMKLVYNPSATFAGQNIGPWNSILGSGPACIKAQATQSLFNGLQGSGLPGTGATVGNNSSSAGSGAGTCAVQTSGSCAQSNLSVFGSAAAQASQICSAESCNGTCLKGDYTTSGVPVSIGTFQINLTAHSVAGLNCPNAFSSVYTGHNHNVQVTNQSLYNQCVQAAMNPTNNAAVAASIYQANGNSFREWSTHTKCGLALGSTTIIALEVCSAESHITI